MGRRSYVWAVGSRTGSRNMSYEIGQKKVWGAPSAVAAASMSGADAGEQGRAFQVDSVGPTGDEFQAVGWVGNLPGWDNVLPLLPPYDMMHSNSKYKWECSCASCSLWLTRSELFLGTNLLEGSTIHCSIGLVTRTGPSLDNVSHHCHSELCHQQHPQSCFSKHK